MDAGQLTVAVVLAWQLGAAERHALVDACTRAFAVGTCALAPRSEDPLGAAVVPAGGAGSESLGAQVEAAEGHRVVLRVRGPDGAEEVQRSLTFLPEDTPLEQAKAVGLTLGVLAGEVQRRRVPAQHEATMLARDPSSPGTSPPRESTAPISDPDDRDESPLRGLATVQIGAGWDPGLETEELGGALRGAWSPGRSPWWLGAVADLWRAEPVEGRVHLSKVQIGASAGVTHPLVRDVQLTFGVDLGIQALRAATAAPLASDRALRIVPVLRATGTLAYWVGDVWGIALTGQGTWVGSRTRLLVQDREVASTGRFGAALLVGPALRWDFGARSGR